MIRLKASITLINSGSGGSGGDGGPGAVVISGSGILVLDARDDSPQLPAFLDLLDNPCNYRGKVVYLTAIGPTPRPDPFLWADKFYFNEGCDWHESPFMVGGFNYEE